MAATLTDAHDHFTEVFGTRRGSGRRGDEDSAEQRPNLALTLNPGSEGMGPLCAGGCGNHVMPAIAEDCGGEEGPWYCPKCFDEEKARREARRSRLVTQSTAPEPTDSRLKVMAEGAALCVVAIAGVLSILVIVSPSLVTI